MKKRWKVPWEEKARIAKECLAGEKTQHAAAREMNVRLSTIQGWISRYKEQGVLAFEGQEHNQVYTEEIKLAAVMDYLEGKGSQQEIAAKYGLRSRTELQQWIKVYNSGKGFRQKMSGGSRMKKARSATVEERIRIAKECIENGGNYGEAAIKYNVSYQQVRQWVKKYKEFGDAGLEDRRGKRLRAQTPRTREEELEVEVAKLKHELYMTKMERDLLKKLDEIERREAYRK